MSEREMVNPIPRDAKRGWEVEFVNSYGRRRPLAARLISAINSRLGVNISYGQQPEGYDGFSIREQNGGGSVTVPYFWKDGNLYVGAIKQERKKMGGYSVEVSRGFSIPTETNEQTARREFAEETGVRESLASRIKLLAKKGTNMNSTFFVADRNKGEGVKFFGLEVKPEEVEQALASSKDPRRRVYKFTPKLQGEITEVNEKIKPEGIRFFHAGVLINSSDAFTKVAIGELLARRK